MRSIDIAGRNCITTEEKVVVRNVHEGVKTYHGVPDVYGKVAEVYAEDNGGTFLFIPPRLTIDGEKFYLVGVNSANRRKTYFHPVPDVVLADAEPDIFPYETPSYSYFSTPVVLARRECLR